MKRIVTAGTLTLALALGGCSAKQPPAPPPLKIVTEAAPKQDAAPPPPTGAELLAQQPREATGRLLGVQVKPLKTEMLLGTRSQVPHSDPAELDGISFHGDSQLHVSIVE